MIKLWIFLVLPVLMSCGHHESETYGQINTGNVTTVEKSTDPLDIAQSFIQSDDAEGLGRQISGGLSPDSRLKNGRPLLVEAVIWEKVKSIQALLDAGASLTLADTDGKDALAHAQDRPHILRILQPASEADAQKLLAAVESNSFSDVKKLIAEGVDPNLLLPNGETALTLAVKLGFENVVRVLLQAPLTDVNMKNGAGESPLMIARASGKSRIQALLLKRGATP